VRPGERDVAVTQAAPDRVDPYRQESSWADPYPHYAHLRDAMPVHCCPNGVWVLACYEDVLLVLRDPRFGRRGFRHLLNSKDSQSNDNGISVSMLFQDPPDHARLRGLVSKAFTPRTIDNLRSRIQQIVDDLLDRAQNSREVDIIADLAFPLPVSVISEMLGIPVLDRTLFHGWSRDIACGSDAQLRSIDAHVAIARYFRELIAERRKQPQSDLLSSLILAEEQGDVLSEAELIDICGLLFVSGHETTANLIGNGLLTLIQHPPELQALREQPSLLPGAVEELLRYDSPIQRAGRVANVPVQFGEKIIPEGAVVSAMIGSANRDPTQFVDPDRLDIKRRDNCHLAFGAGTRFCLGAMLARAEAQIAIGTLLRRMLKLELVGDKLEWRRSVETRGLKKLRVRL
jgi:pimeloyl-[acyl-carrier protein] synthase